MNDQIEPVETRLRFDTHADVSCAGSDGEILEIIKERLVLFNLSMTVISPSKE